MHLRKASLLTVILLVHFTSALADVKKSLSVELPTLTLAGEFGVKASPTDYLAVSIYAGAQNVYGAGVSWTRSISSNQSHWFGLGAGHMSGDDDNFIVSFDIESYASLDYKYFKNGWDERGFYFNTSFRVASGDAFPWFGFGYHY